MSNVNQNKRRYELSAAELEGEVVAFQKRKLTIVKKAHELSVMTGSQVFLLLAHEGDVDSYVTSKFLPIINQKNLNPLVKTCFDSIGIKPSQINQNQSWSVNSNKPARPSDRIYSARNIFRPFKIPKNVTSLSKKVRRDSYDTPSLIHSPVSNEDSSFDTHSPKPYFGQERNTKTYSPRTPPISPRLKSGFSIGSIVNQSRERVPDRLRFLSNVSLQRVSRPMHKRIRVQDLLN
ncbi:hypothetical protein BC833DRAFT_593045 [Globomyces pollinis-pini]|nr:hypothetical protein BC833DRAFT_593045 [Globomyces pollinis-pini]KAJ2990975.1 hypothetical protein HDV02_004058 [Globomyces sp. JEL0801]